MNRSRVCRAGAMIFILALLARANQDEEKQDEKAREQAVKQLEERIDEVNKTIDKTTATAQEKAELKAFFADLLEKAENGVEAFGTKDNAHTLAAAYKDLFNIHAHGLTKAGIVPDRDCKIFVEIVGAGESGNFVRVIPNNVWAGAKLVVKITADCPSSTKIQVESVPQGTYSNNPAKITFIGDPGGNTSGGTVWTSTFEIDARTANAGDVIVGQYKATCTNPNHVCHAQFILYLLP